MAEIKSTLEMVMERAAKMAASATTDTDNENLIKAGMRLGATFLNNNNTDLAEELGKHSETDRKQVLEGIIKTLLRNIVLPREEQSQESGKAALQGLVLLAKNTREIQTICQELEQILEQYGQHKEQTTKQLDDAIRAQLEQQQMASGQQDQGPVNPAMHPQYKEELTKMLTSLNNQYNEALDQRKQMISQYLTQSS
jgi:hypothetical protein